MFTEWAASVDGLVEDGAIVVVRTDEEEDGIVICGDDIFSDHGACFRVLGEMEACTIRFARARAAELGNADPTVVLASFSVGGGNAVHVALFGATLEERWDEFATAGGPPERLCRPGRTLRSPDRRR